MTPSSYPGVALVLPPVQSFFMPYAAPAALAAALAHRRRVRTLVVDGGIEWLWHTLAARGTPDQHAAIDALRRPGSYDDAFTLQAAFLRARDTLAALCRPSGPERVLLSGRYEPGEALPDWAAVERSLEQTRSSLFDDYFRHDLVPRLRRFRAQIVGLSIPFDWMSWPALRLVRWLRRSCPDVQIVIGGPAVERLWYEGASELFRICGAHWAAIGDGAAALDALVGYLVDGVEPTADGPLVRLPASTPGSVRPAARNGGDPLPGPDYSDLDLSLYLRPQPILPIPASEGCFYGQCRFCSRQRSDQSVPYAEQPPEHVAGVMRRLERQTGAKQFILAGDIFTHRFLLSLARALEREHADFTWFCEASFKSSMAGKLSGDDCRQLRRGGCRLILNGLESGSAEMRERMGCPVREQVYEQTLVALEQAGVVPYVTIVFGYPGEGSDELMETVRFIQKHVDRAVFATSRFEVVPGTPLARELSSRDDVSLLPRGVLEGGMGHRASDTLAPEAAATILERELGGMFGGFAEFMRQIPILMQLLDKRGHSSAAAIDARAEATKPLTFRSP